MKITNDFIGNETKALTKTKISAILRWWGFNPDSYSTWGNARSDMNNILSGTPTSEISDRERASSFLSKINYINDTDTVISDISFASSEAGVWYDPSDLSTLFQDAAGTIPVTGVEQPVGRMLDKTGRGNHASQATTTARPILSARYNLLASTEDCSRVWVLTSNVIGSNVTCPDGRPGILITKSATATNAHAKQRLGNSIVNATYSYQLAIYAGSTNSVSVGIGATNDGSGVWGDTNATVTKIAGPGSVSSQSGLGIVTGLSSTVPTVVRVQRKYVSSVIAYVYVYPGTHTSSTEGHSVIVQDVDCRFAFDRINLPSYQRVGDLTTNSADYDIVGFAPYLRFDGVDDSLSTAPFSANSSICQVCVSLKKLTDAHRGVVLEYGNNSNNSLLIDTGVSTGSHTLGPFIRLTSRGTTSFSAGMVDVGGLPAPAMALLYGEASTTSNITRVFLNGSLSGEASGNQGGGDYAQSSLFIGSRNNSLLRFSGRLYQMILRFGATSGNIKSVFETQARNARRSY